MISLLRAAPLAICCAIFIFVVSAIAQDGVFVSFVKKRLADEAKKTDSIISLTSVCSTETDPLAKRVFLEYGSMFAATDEIRLPSSCIFRSPAEIDLFHKRLEIKKHLFGFTEIELQEDAMESLVKAREEAESMRMSITPLDGAIAGRRGYDDTVRIWNSRFFRALSHWERRGRISASEADVVRRSTVAEQITRVVEWEKQGIYFSTNFTKSIFHSVAPPGTSQHLSLIAFDVVEANDPAVRRILNKHGWFQTIRTDRPHFTYLGVDEKELPGRGLKMIVHQGNFYWVPNIE